MGTGKSLKQVSALELITLCSNDDSEAWDEFINRFHRHIMLCTLRELRNYKSKDNDVSEMVQEVFLRLLANERKVLKEFRGTTDASILAYLAIIVRSTVTDAIRKEVAQKRSAPTVSLDAPLKSGEDQDLSLADILAAEETSSPSWILKEKIAPKRLREILKTVLSGANATRDAIIFHLHVINGLSAREIAELPSFSMTTNNVQAIIFRTKERLRDVIGKEGLAGF